ncbi:MAG: hypothetical protein M1829_000851 [Trizodia sp. TS-e1964]|nr:MAG: hypothetical protein M1829_000851 [Trizodia sp. TS-e1964]
MYLEPAARLTARDIFYPGPPGTEPNYDAPNPIGVFINTINIVFVTIAGLLVIARIYTRTVMTRSLGWDDLLIVASLVSAIVWTVAVVLQTQTGQGKHAYDIVKTDENLTAYFKASRPLDLEFVQTISNYFSLLESKASLIIMYLRTFATSRALKISYLVALFVVVTSHVAFIIIFVISIQPIYCRWNDVECSVLVETVPPIDFISAITILLDIYLVVVAIRIVMRLKLSTKQKVGLCAVVAFGLVVTAVSIYRLYIITAHSYFSNDPDTTHVSTGWASALEIHLSIICACLPTLRLFFISLFQKTSQVLSGTGSSSKRTTDGVTAFNSKKSKPAASKPESWQHQSVPEPSSSYMELTSPSQKSSEGVITEESEEA